MSDRTDAIMQRVRAMCPNFDDIESEIAAMETDLMQQASANARLGEYAVTLRTLVNKEIIELSKAGFQGSADKLEDSLDRVDAMIGEGPYAAKNPSPAGHLMTEASSATGGSPDPGITNEASGPVGLGPHGCHAAGQSQTPLCDSVASALALGPGHEFQDRDAWEKTARALERELEAAKGLHSQ